MATNHIWISSNENVVVENDVEDDDDDNDSRSISLFYDDHDRFFITKIATVV